MSKLNRALFCALLIFSAPAFAADQSDGCGVGWKVTEKYSFLATSTRGTTNAFLPPTFSMTSGTSGCTQHSITQREEPAAKLAVVSSDSLVVEIARGEGETLESFIRALGCSETHRSQVTETLQENLPRILQAGETSPIEFYKEMRSSLRGASQPCTAIL